MWILSIFTVNSIRKELFQLGLQIIFLFCNHFVILISDGGKFDAKVLLLSCHLILLFGDLVSMMKICTCYVFFFLLSLLHLHVN